MTAQPARPGSSRAGQRRHSRLRVCLPGKLVTLSGTLHATLLDLSFHGAKIATGGFVTPDGDAVLSWDRFEAFCRIAWCHGDRCGLDFDEPLHGDVLMATRALADATPPTDTTRQGTGRRPRQRPAGRLAEDPQEWAKRPLQDPILGK